MRELINLSKKKYDKHHHYFYTHDDVRAHGDDVMTMPTVSQAKVSKFRKPHNFSQYFFLIFKNGKSNATFYITGENGNIHTFHYIILNAF